MPAVQDQVAERPAVRGDHAPVAEVGFASAATAAPPPVPKTDRLPFLDLLRAVSAHVIVWHHLVFYGPLSDVVAPYIPYVYDVLYEYGRYAVQVFFVVGGFVTAVSLGKRTVLTFRDVSEIVRRRYLRIAGPYLAVLVLAVVANTVADFWMDHDSISDFPTVPQLLAHTVFLHDVLGYEALSAGVWYLAIDFQLNLLVLAMFWVSHRLAGLLRVSPLAISQALIWPLAAASLLFFNRTDTWDMWAVYFFGSYALGLLTAWALSGRLPAWSFWLYLGLMLAALAVDFRPRLIVSLSTGLLIFAAGRTGWLSRPTNRIVAFAGASSYSLFLVHFPVCLLVNAFLSQYVLDSPALCLVGMFAAYGLSILASIVFYHGVERAFQRERRAVGTVTAAA